MLSLNLGPESEAVEHQPGDKRDSGEVPVEGKKAGAVFQGNGCNQGINCGKRHAFSACLTVDLSRHAISCKALGLEHVPPGEKLLNTTGVPGEALQELGYHHSRQGE